MKTYIALLRGINVGGKGILPMSELVAILAGLGCANAKTYIQSGNAVFEHKASEAIKLASKIGAAILKKRGFEPHVIVLDSKVFARVVEENPFPEAVADPKSLHVFFLDATPAQAALEPLANIKSKSERFALLGKAFYLHAADGIGNSKLAAKVERHLGVHATCRNWRTVCKLLEMTDKCG
jgi:uncharacterized protein (DUF1697 family)